MAQLSSGAKPLRLIQLMYFRRALKADSKFAPAYTNLGKLHYEESGKGYLDNAIEYFEKAAELESDIGLHFYNLGLAFFKNDDLTKAERNIRKASELSPEDPDINYALGLVYAKRKRKNQAVKYFEKTLAINPEYENAKIAMDIINPKTEDTMKLKIPGNFPPDQPVNQNIVRPENPPDSIPGSPPKEQQPVVKPENKNGDN